MVSVCFKKFPDETRKQGLYSEIAFPRNIQSYTHEISLTLSPKNNLKKDDINKPTYMDKESSWGLKVWNLPNELRAAKGFWEQEKCFSAGKILLTSYQMNVKSYETGLSNFQPLLLEILWTQGEDLHVGF